MSSDDEGEMNETISASTCRIAIVGAQRMRVAKVASLLNSDKSLVKYQPHSKGPTFATDIEYLPCVAAFGSYKDGSGDIVRYLEKIEYHGPDGSSVLGSSLAPFFDSVDDDDKDDGSDRAKIRFDGISAIAIGCGIESTHDVSMIETFVKSICSSPGEDEGFNSAPLLECIEPNANFSSMKEENEAYRSMSADEKAEMTQLGTLGPSKMAKFAFSLAEGVIRNAIDAALLKEVEVVVQQDEQDDEEVTRPPIISTRDPSKVQFACRICRTILFDEDDLENPPHSKACHIFNRKHDKPVGRSLASQCESKFLSGGLDWMGDIGAMEGKLHCPKCEAKVGLWKWAGAQCSCGTWVTPAIQIPIGKVDELNSQAMASSAGLDLASLSVQPAA